MPQLQFLQSPLPWSAMANSGLRGDWSQQRIDWVSKATHATPSPVLRSGIGIRFSPTNRSAANAAVTARYQMEF